MISFAQYCLLEKKKRKRKKKTTSACNKCFKHRWAPWSTGGFGGYEIADAAGAADGMAAGGGE